MPDPIAVSTETIDARTLLAVLARLEDDDLTARMPLDRLRVAVGSMASSS